VMDPPTEFTLRSEAGNAKSASAKYKTMPWPAIEALPVGHLAKANAIFLLWGCPPTLPQSLRLLERLGARYKTELVWRKVTINGKPRGGTGYRAQGYHESVLMGVFGDERQIHDRFPGMFDGVEDPRDGLMFEGLAREHSRKPDEFYKLVQEKTPGAYRCDLFSRATHPGFDGWGDQHGMFDDMPMADPEQRAIAAASLDLA
jgi:N6-adenosine-specific RNA methylase IME4